MIEHVELTSLEVRYAVCIGRERNESAIAKGLRPAHGFKGDALKIHIDGAAGEIAFCKWAGIYFSPTIDTFKLPDVGDLIQIRTRSKHHYELIVRKDADDGHIFVLLTGEAPDFRVVGWLFGREAKREQFLQTYGNREAAFFVPHDHLRNPKLLRVVCRGKTK